MRIFFQQMNRGEKGCLWGKLLCSGKNKRFFGNTKKLFNAIIKQLRIMEKGNKINKFCEVQL